MEKQRPRILAAVQDLFFAAKITAAAQRVGVPVEFVPDEQKLLKETESGWSVVLLDLNNSGFDPIDLIGKLKANSAGGKVQILAYVSHVQQELKRRAEAAGCDLVLPRSVFSQQLDELLRQRACHL